VIEMPNLFQDEFSWFLDLCGTKMQLKKPFQPIDMIRAIGNEMAKEDIGLLRENEGKKYPCGRCGYVYCVCTPYRTQNLPHRKA